MRIPPASPHTGLDTLRPASPCPPGPTSRLAATSRPSTALPHFTVVLPGHHDHGVWELLTATAGTSSSLKALVGPGDGEDAVSASAHRDETANVVEPRIGLRGGKVGENAVSERHYQAASGGDAAMRLPYSRPAVINRICRL
jgi:hypothetical protein